MKKLILVYNSDASHAAAVKSEVIDQVRKMPGWMVGRFEVKKLTVDENAELLARMLDDGDLVVSAGGDGTAAVAMNGVMLSGKDVALGVMGYGNFNDMARMLGVKRPMEVGGEYVGGVKEIVEKFGRGETAEIYPLEILLDDRHWRWVACYMTMGLLAEAARVMDEKKVRGSLKTGKRGLIFSLIMAMKWFFRNRRREFLSAKMTMNGVGVSEKMTDYLAVNGPRLARLMKGGKWYLDEKNFGSTMRGLKSFWKMVGFGLRSVTKGLRLVESKNDVIEFEEESEVEIQAEGECQRVMVKKIEVRKRGKLKVVLGQ